MAFSKYRSKVDANQPAIVKKLRDLGCSVQPVHQIGGGFPDILVGKAGVNVLVEIKDGTRPPSHRVLTPDEAVFHEKWRGWVAIIENEIDAVNLVKAIVSHGTLEKAK